MYHNGSLKKCNNNKIKNIEKLLATAGILSAFWWFFWVDHKVKFQLRVFPKGGSLGRFSPASPCSCLPTTSVLPILQASRSWVLKSWENVVGNVVSCCGSFGVAGGVFSFRKKAQLFLFVVDHLSVPFMSSPTWARTALNEGGKK